MKTTHRFHHRPAFYAQLGLVSSLLVTLLPGLSALAASGQEKPTTPGKSVLPLIAERYANDADGDRIDDRLFDRPRPSMALERTAETVDVELIFKEPVTQQQINTFIAMGGEISYLYKAVSYGWNGRIPLNKVHAVPAAMGSTLVLVDGARSGGALMDRGTAVGRVRKVWSASFAGSPSGFSGNSNTTIAIMDSGVDRSHMDLAGRGVYWRDFTASNYLSPVDFDNHGTHVAAIALGTGVAGSNNGPIRFTQNGDLTTAANGSGPDKFPIDIPTNAVTVTITAKWNGGGNTTLALSSRAKGIGGVFGWTGIAAIAGPSPLTLIRNLPADAGRATNNYSPVLIQNSSLSVADYVVTCEISNAPPVSDGFERFRGVAPGCNWAGVKVLDDAGHNDNLAADLGAAIDELVSLRTVHNIKVANLSLGVSGLSESLRQKVNTLVSNGIVAVVAAGNDGGPGNDPARAALALTVAAASDINQLTDYSSTGLFSPDASAGEDYKPDLMAPGGSRLGYQTWLVSADSNSSDASFSDQRTNDYRAKWGTSMASPYMAGCAALVIEAMERSGVVWDFNSGDHSRFVKMVLCATASESNTTRENNSSNPTLQQAAGGPNGFPAGKDPYEGYGNVNADAAVEAVALTYTPGTNFVATSTLAPTDRRVWAWAINLPAGRNFHATLSVTNGDFDLYLYSATPSNSGTPVILTNSAQAGTNVSEVIDFLPGSDQGALLVVKRIPNLGADSAGFNFEGHLEPISDFAANVTSGFIPLTVNFTNLTVGDSTSYAWDFGDGNISTDTDAVNIYTNAGSYTVTLTAVGPGGSNVVSRAGYILAAAPPAILSPEMHGDEITFHFETIPGKTYVIEYKDSLEDPVWQPLLNIPGDGGTKAVTNSIGTSEKRFFRLNVE